jgi:hypothetical protein
LPVSETKTSFAFSIGEKYHGENDIIYQKDRTNALITFHIEEKRNAN